MKRDFGTPRYGDILCFTCLFYPLTSTSIGFIALGIDNGVGIMAATFLFCFFVYLPVTSLVFACIRKNERARACIVSTFVGLLVVYFVCSLIAFGLLGVSMGLQGVGIGLLILSMPYIISSGVYLYLLRFI